MNAMGVSVRLSVWHTRADIFAPMTEATSQHLLTRRMAGLLDKIRRAGRPPFHAQSVAEARQSYTAGAEVLEPPRAALARVQAVHVPAGDGALLDARLYAASNQPLPVLLFLHGGGFTIGNLE